MSMMGLEPDQTSSGCGAALDERTRPPQRVGTTQPPPSERNEGLMGGPLPTGGPRCVRASRPWVRGPRVPGFWASSSCEQTPGETHVHRASLCVWSPGGLVLPAHPCLPPASRQPVLTTSRHPHRPGPLTALCSRRRPEPRDPDQGAQPDFPGTVGSYPCCGGYAPSLRDGAVSFAFITSI